VRFLTEAAGGDLAKINAKDRWGGTPLGDATFNSAKECADVIREAGGLEVCVCFLSGVCACGCEDEYLGTSTSMNVFYLILFFMCVCVCVCVFLARKYPIPFVYR